jgi:Kip1 ubiquitination-promoting complex protein 1
MELLDGLVVLYHSAAHKQLSKMWALQDNMRDFVLALQDTQEKIDRCPPDVRP